MSVFDLKVIHEGSSNKQRRDRLDKMVAAFVIASPAIKSQSKHIVDSALKLLEEIDKRFEENNVQKVD